MYNPDLREDEILEKTQTHLIEKLTSEMTPDNCEQNLRDIGALQNKRLATRQRNETNKREPLFGSEYSLPSHINLK